MKNNLKTLAVIPARGGSKRLENKNIKSFGGFPLIVFSIAIAKQLDFIDRVIVSTEDEKISQIANHFGANVFDRNPMYSTDSALPIDYLKEIYEHYIEKGVKYDHILLLQPTSPLRTISFLKGGYEQHLKNLDSTSSTISIKEEKIPLGTIDSNGYFHLNDPNHLRSQDINSSYYPTGSFYLFNCSKTITKNNYFGLECCPYFIDDNDFCLDIDTIDEFEYGEYLLNKNLKKYQPIYHYIRETLRANSKKKNA